MKKTFYAILVAIVALCLSSCGNSLKDGFDSKMHTIGAAELGTVEYTITKVVKADDNADWYKFGDRKILFTVKATMKAGISIDSPNSYSAQIDESTKSITLTLPEPKVLSLNMRAEDTKLEYEQVSITRFDFDNMERNSLLRQAEEDIKNDKSLGILKDAQDNAEMFFKAMLAQVGFEKITINFANN